MIKAKCGNALIIGLGSIGNRHKEVLRQLGVETFGISRRPDADFQYEDLSRAVEILEPNCIVVANESDQHSNVLENVLGMNYQGKILVEKPFLTNIQSARKVYPDNVFVGYNLRFHPVMKKLVGLLEGEELVSAVIYVGQYLPDWRPEQDYKKSYSAFEEKGGGVLYDLSHEIDYAKWICGDCETLTAIGGHFSELEINSSDVYMILMQTKDCPAVSLSLNYLDRSPRRTITINTASHTIVADLIENFIIVDGYREHFDVDVNDSYVAMHRSLISNDIESLCTASEGIRTVELIMDARAANEKKTWIRSR